MFEKVKSWFNDMKHKWNNLSDKDKRKVGYGVGSAFVFGYSIYKKAKGKKNDQKHDHNEENKEQKAPEPYYVEKVTVRKKIDKGSE